MGLTVAEVFHQRFDCPLVLLKQGTAGITATILPEKGEERERADLSRLKLRQNVLDGELVCSGEADVCQAQTPPEGYVIDDLYRVAAVELSGIQVLASLFGPIFRQGGNWRSHRADRADVSEEIPLLLKLLPHAARAFIENGKIQPSLTFYWQELLLRAFF